MKALRQALRREGALLQTGGASRPAQNARQAELACDLWQLEGLGRPSRHELPAVVLRLRLKSGSGGGFKLFANP